MTARRTCVNSTDVNGSLVTLLSALACATCYCFLLPQSVFRVFLFSTPCLTTAS
jgi:hypothetical protein